MTLLRYWTNSIALWCRRSQLAKFVVLSSLAIFYTYGLFFSDNAQYIHIPSTTLSQEVSVVQPSQQYSSHTRKHYVVNNTSVTSVVKFPRSLPYLRVVNTIHSYQKYVDSKNKDSEKTDDDNKNGESNVLSTSTTQSTIPYLVDENNNDNNRNKTTTTTSTTGPSSSSSKLIFLQPFISLCIYILLCRLFLAILIYRNSNQSFEIDVDDMGQIRQRRTTMATYTHPNRRRSFWEIFRTIPLRTRGRYNRLEQIRQAQFFTFAMRLNQQRRRNGVRPLDIQSLALIFSNRDFNGLDYDSLTGFEEQNDSFQNSHHHGASEQDINRCPVRILAAGDELVSTAYISSDEEQQRQQEENIENFRSEGGTHCSICLESYQVDDMIRTLPCCHCMHQHCVDRWLKQKAICPVCKRSIL